MRKMKTDVPEIDQIPYFMKVLDDMSVGHSVYLWGTKGTGKSHLSDIVSYSFMGRNRSDKKELPYVEINSSNWSSPTEIIGGQTMDGYREGKLIEAWRDGKTLIIDEMPKLDPNTAGLLNAPLAKMANKDAVIFNALGQPFVKHKDFACIASGNIKPYSTSLNYVGNNQQDASLWDRFAANSYQIGFNETLEESLIYPVIVAKCWQVRNAVINYDGGNGMDNDNENHIITLRTMLNFQRIYELEMKRELRITDSQGTYTKIKNGKTLMDSFESYFSTMSKEKAHHIKEASGIEAFYNSYKGANAKEDFKKEYKRRNN